MLGPSVMTKTMPDCECPPTRSPGCVVVVRHAVYGMMHLMSAGLSKLEWWQLLKLLRRYAERDLDQFDAWQFDTASGPVFVQLRRELRADESAEAFRRVDPGGGYSTGRPARVGDLAGVATREDLRRLVGQMHADFVESGVLEWENAAERFEPFRGQHAANGAGPGVYMGPVELQAGLAAAALGRLDAAVADLSAAVSICDANGARGYAVQARVELAALAGRQARGDLGQAGAALDAAAGEAEQLGMVPFTERIGQLRARLPATAAARSPLSPRELQVASLVAKGLTNKQIGEALYVSERTAENHVRHILISSASAAAARSPRGPAKGWLRTRRGPSEWVPSD